MGKGLLCPLQTATPSRETLMGPAGSLRIRAFTFVQLSGGTSCSPGAPVMENAFIGEVLQLIQELNAFSLPWMENK